MKVFIGSQLYDKLTQDRDYIGVEYDVWILDVLDKDNALGIG